MQFPAALDAPHAYPWFRPSGMERARARAAEAIADLVVWHRPGTPSAETGHAPPEADVLTIRTCQREVRIDRVARFSPVEAGTEIHRGADAYRFLLEFTTGLKSAIAGEADVFGQVREAWRVFEGKGPRATVRALAPLMDALFRDARAVRTRFLQGIGGQSYATLTRRLLATSAESRILIVGAGALGRSLLSKFGTSEIAVFNRTPPAGLPRTVRRLFGPGEEQAAVEWATHVVMCVPRHADIDRRWIPLLRSRIGLRVVHLACRREAPGAWREVATLIDLDEVFDLQRRQAELRGRQIAHAREACADLAGRAVSGALI